MVDRERARWRKSARSGNGNNCVEAALNFAESDGVVLIRDSKDPDGPILTVGVDAWAELVAFARTSGL